MGTIFRGESVTNFLTIVFLSACAACVDLCPIFIFKGRDLVKVVIKEGLVTAVVVCFLV